MASEAALAGMGQAVGEERNPFVTPQFRRWWAASVVAGTGAGIQVATVPLFITGHVSHDHRALAISAALLAANLPGALLALVGGVVADRVERRRILVRTYSVAALVSTAYVFITGFDLNAVWPVFILAAIVGSAGAFTNPARQSMMPQILQRSQLQNGVIFGTMAFMASFQFVGPTVGGVVADSVSLTVAFGCEVVLLASAGVLFSRIAVDRPVPSGRHIFGDLADGLRYARKSSTIVGLLLLGTIPGMFLIGPFQVANPLMVKDVLHASDKFVGILWGCFGLGVFTGSVLLSIRRLPRRGLAVAFSVVFGGIFMVAFGLSESLPLSMTMLFLQGLAPAVFINFVSALLQETTEQKMMGRVMSMYSLAFMASTPVGNVQAGLVANFWGPQPTVVASGLIAVGIGVLCVLFLRPVTRLR